MALKICFRSRLSGPIKLGEPFRDVEGEGASQSSETYAKMKAATEEATIAVESTVEHARSMQEMAGKLAGDMSKPGRQGAEGAMASFRTA